MQTSISETKQPHNLTIQNRQSILMTGVVEVISATPTQINVKTVQGNLLVGGSNLSIKDLKHDAQEMEICGTILELKYDHLKKKFFEKCFK